MTANEFNTKWKNHLDEGHYGLDFNIEEIIDVIDDTFYLYKTYYPDFKYQQIKIKFDEIRVYMINIEQRVVELLERQLNMIYKNSVL